MLREISQFEKDSYSIVHLCEAPRLFKCIETESKMVIAGGWEEEEMGSCFFSRYRVSILQGEKVLLMDDTTMRIYFIVLNCTQKWLQWSILRYVHFTTIKIFFQIEKK